MLSELHSSPAAQLQRCLGGHPTPLHDNMLTSLLAQRGLMLWDQAPQAFWMWLFCCCAPMRACTRCSTVAAGLSWQGLQTWGPKAPVRHSRAFLCPAAVSLRPTACERVLQLNGASAAFILTYWLMHSDTPTCSCIHS